MLEHLTTKDTLLLKSKTVSFLSLINDKMFKPSVPPTRMTEFSNSTIFGPFATSGRLGPIVQPCRKNQISSSIKKYKYKNIKTPKNYHVLRRN